MTHQTEEVTLGESGPDHELGPDQVSDAVLVQQARRGDTEAMVTLYRRYLGEVYGYLYNQIGDRDDAEDVTSETFLRLVRGLGDFGGRSSFRTWLYSIARNCLRDHWRKSERHAASPLDPDRPPAADQEMATEARPEVTRLGRAVLEQLPESYRTVVTLRVLDGRSIRDTAEVMGTSLGNVKILQHRALKRAAEIANALSSEDDR